MSRNRINRLSLSPDPPATNTTASIKYNSGLVRQQQERNSPSYQSYKKLNHDYENTYHSLQQSNGSISKTNKSFPSQTLPGLVSRRSAEFESKSSAELEANKNKFLQGTLQGSTSSNGLLNLNNASLRQKSPFQLVQPKQPSSTNGGMMTKTNTASLIRNTSNLTLPNKSPSPYGQRQIIPDQPIYQNHPGQAHPQQQQQQQPVTVIQAGDYKSQIENKVKLMQGPQTYMSNMHVRVPSQDSSIYSDTKTYIDVGQPVAIAPRKGNVILNPSPSQFGQQPGGGAASRGKTKQSQTNNQPAIPRSQEVKKYIEPSFSAVLKQNQAIYANYDFRSSDGSSQTEDEIGYTSPPSPVSSSYSELRVATRAPISFPTQLNPQALMYDPLYEPISGQSSISQYKPNFGLGGPSSHYDDNFGPCSKCLEMIIGEGTGCMARGQLFHIKCFTCHKCGCQLQGQPFYPIDGKSYCEADYLNTLEKCCKCSKPILDRILRATGKPYHPTCFTCVICHTTLDGVPFTVDATNEIHCIGCFHKRFAPKCSVCKTPIMTPDPGQQEVFRVVALDRSFHVQCYKCEDCGLLLSSEAEGKGCYPLDDHVLCKACNTKRIQLLTQDIQ